MRLLFEDAGVPYNDPGADWSLSTRRATTPEEKAAANQSGYSNITKALGTASFALPYLKHGDLEVGQTANQCLYIGIKLGLAGKTEADQFRCNAVALTIIDVVDEVHDSHHAISSKLTYEDQKEPSLLRAAYFTTYRIPGFFKYFNNILQANEESKNEYLIGSALTYPDLMLFHLMSGLEFAYPTAYKKNLGDFPLLAAHRDRIAIRPNVAAFLASERSIPWCEGLFRFYPELDEAVAPPLPSY